MEILKDISKFKILTSGIPKNALLFLLGLLFYVMIYGKINPLNAVLGLVSMAIAYSSVYPYNDINDMESDKKNSFRKIKNPIVSGKVKIKNAVNLVFLLLIVGVFFSIPLNSIFKIFFFTSLFFNFIHSSNYTRHYNKSLTFKFFLVIPMEFAKFAMGWFSQTIAFDNFPLVIGITASLIYSEIYYLYKREMLDSKEFLKHKTLSISFILLTIACIVAVIIFFKFKFLLFTLVALFTLGGILLGRYGYQKFLFKSIFFILLLLTIIAMALSIYFYSTSPIPSELDSLAYRQTEKIRITVENATNSTLAEIIDEIQKIASIQKIIDDVNKTIIIATINSTTS